MSIMNVVVSKTFAKFKPWQASRSYGIVFRCFDKSKRYMEDHPLDTDLNEYFKVLREVIIPTCRQLVAPTAQFADRLEKVIDYNVPNFHTTWNFGVELTYKMITPDSEKTPENMIRMRVLRWCMDMLYSMAGVLDDICDGGKTRLGKPSWVTLTSDGPKTALYDGCLLGYLPFLLINRFCSHLPTYPQLLYTIAKSSISVTVGQILDVTEQGRMQLSEKDYNDLASFKTGGFTKVMPALGMYLAGITDVNKINTMEAVFNELGLCSQIWDDFNDYYSGPDQTGKLACDFVNGNNTWVSSTAFKYFNEEEKIFFKSCYGTKDPEKVRIVNQMYDSVNLKTHYISRMEEALEKIEKLSKGLNDEKLQQVVTSYSDWFIGNPSSFK